MKKIAVISIAMNVILTITLVAALMVISVFVKKFDNNEDKYAMENLISIMVYDDTVKDYIQSNNIPVGSYKLNEEKTVCSAGGTISKYDNLNGTLKYNLETSDECYIYFDEYFGAVKTIIDLYKGQGTVVGDGKLYFHDETLANGAEDNSYRYAGINPDNYVCFENDDCKNVDNLYRIIGIFGERLKLIKYNGSNTMAWNTSGNNTWNGSSLEKYLNNTWLPTLGFNAELIEMTKWKVGEMSWDSNRIVKEYFELEKINAVTIDRKIGLIYPSDYGYAAESTYWLTSLYSYSTAAYTTNWIHISGIHQWIITPYSVGTNYAFFIGHNGGLYYNGIVSNTVAVRPSFYLIPTAKIKEGDGSSGNPYIITK